MTDYDLIGVGFGPANLALACALAEQSAEKNRPVKSVLFIEKHDTFRWHPGMLLPGVKMQISFLKDLATLRNPQSPYTFISYLHHHDRLASFINRGSSTPSRKEFADYLGWIANQVQANGVDVHYGQEVVSIDQTDDGWAVVHSRDLGTGHMLTQRARNIVISPGGSPFLPRVFENIVNHPLFVHSSAFAFAVGTAFEKMASLKRGLRICVVGSGQSAAEVTMNMRDRLFSIDPANSRHEIDVILRKGSFKPSDDSPFSNEIFDPSSTDTWYSTTSQAIRDSRLAEYQTTNYGVVNPTTLDSLYEVVYDQKVDEAISSRTASTTSNPFIRLLTNTSIISADSGDSQDAFRFMTRDALSRSLTERKYDFVVCATGYQRTSWSELISSSNLGKRYGIRPGSTVKLTQAHAVPTTLFEAENIREPTLRSLSPTSDLTPITTPEDSGEFEDYKSSLVSISRNYRLICASDLPVYPRVYLQGVEEGTHGLSDTLLSVAGIRAGEVVADLNRDPLT